jgi:hypothetical protein
MTSSHLHIQATLLLAQIDAYLDKNPPHFKDSFVLTKGENKTYAVAFRVNMPDGRMITHLDHVCADCAQDICETTNHSIMAERFYRNTDTPKCAGCDAHLDFMAGASWMGDVVTDAKQGHLPSAIPETLFRLRGNIVREIDNLPYDQDAKFWLQDLMALTHQLFDFSDLSLAS